MEEVPALKATEGDVKLFVIAFYLLIMINKPQVPSSQLLRTFRGV